MNTLLACLLAFVKPIVDKDMYDPDCTSGARASRSRSSSMIADIP